MRPFYVNRGVKSHDTSWPKSAETSKTRKFLRILRRVLEFAFISVIAKSRRYWLSLLSLLLLPNFLTSTCLLCCETTQPPQADHGAFFLLLFTVFLFARWWETWSSFAVKQSLFSQATNQVGHQMNYNMWHSKLCVISFKVLLINDLWMLRGRFHIISLSIGAVFA